MRDGILLHLSSQEVAEVPFQTSIINMADSTKDFTHAATKGTPTTNVHLTTTYVLSHDGSEEGMVMSTVKLSCSRNSLVEPISFVALSLLITSLEDRHTVDHQVKKFTISALLGGADGTTTLISRPSSITQLSVLGIPSTNRATN